MRSWNPFPGIRSGREAGKISVADVVNTLVEAETIASRMHDEYTRWSTFFLSLLENATETKKKNIFSTFNINKDAFLKV
jgi:hypothetical protein